MQDFNEEDKDTVFKNFAIASSGNPEVYDELREQKNKI